MVSDNRIWTHAHDLAQAIELIKSEKRLFLIKELACLNERAHLLLVSEADPENQGSNECTDRFGSPVDTRGYPPERKDNV